MHATHLSCPPTTQGSLVLADWLTWFNSHELWVVLADLVRIPLVTATASSLTVITSSVL